MNHTFIYKYKLAANFTECFERNFDKLQYLLAFADSQKIEALNRFPGVSRNLIEKCFA